MSARNSHERAADIISVCPHTQTTEDFTLVHDEQGVLAWCRDCRRVWPLEALTRPDDPAAAPWWRFLGLL